MLLRCRWFRKDCRKRKKVKKDGKSVISRFVERFWKVRPRLLGFRDLKDVRLMFDVGVKKSESVSDQDKLLKQNALYKRFIQNPRVLNTNSKGFISRRGFGRKRGDFALGNFFLWENFIENIEKLHDSIHFNNKKLRALHQPCPNINIDNLILKSYPRKSAMHYASYLWNWNFKEKAARCFSVLKCTQKTLCLTIRNMKDSDLEIVKTIIKDAYLTHLPSIEQCDSLESIKYLLISEICNTPRCVGVLIEVIQKWYTVLPILKELSTCTSWDYICATEACLLGVDTLYAIFLNIVYKTPQPNTL